MAWWTCCHFALTIADMYRIIESTLSLPLRVPWEPVTAWLNTGINFRPLSPFRSCIGCTVVRPLPQKPSKAYAIFGIPSGQRNRTTADTIQSEPARRFSFHPITAWCLLLLEQVPARTRCNNDAARVLFLKLFVLGVPWVACMIYSFRNMIFAKEGKINCLCIYSFLGIWHLPHADSALPWVFCHQASVLSAICIFSCTRYLAIKEPLHVTFTSS